MRNFVEEMERRLLFSAPAHWIAMGQGGGGAFYAPSISPDNPNEVYLSSDMREEFHSTNFGQTWNYAETWQNDQKTEIQGGYLSTVRFTADPAIRYALDYSLYPDDRSAVPKRSTDGGKTWVRLSGWEPGNLDTPGDSFSIFADPEPGQANHILVSSFRNLYFSNDGGNTFASVYSDSEQAYIAGAYFDGSTIYVATNRGLLISNNSGLSFSPLPNSGFDADQGIYSFTAARQNGTVRFFAITANADELFPGREPGVEPGTTGLYTLTPGQGDTWSNIASGPLTGYTYKSVANSASDINTVYVSLTANGGYPQIFKSIDAGQSWTSVFNYQNNQNIRTGWIGDGGDFPWWLAAGGREIAVAPNDPSRLVVTDIDFVYTSSDGGATWDADTQLAADRNPVNTLITPHKAYRSSGLDPTSVENVTFLAPNRIFIGSADVSGGLSTNDGLSWERPDFGSPLVGLNSIYDVAKVGTTYYAAQSDQHDLYQSGKDVDTGLDGSILYSTDQAQTWHLLHDFGHPVVDVAADPTDANTLYASVVNTATGGIYVTHNLSAGTSALWTKLPNPPRTQGHPYVINVLANGDLVVSYSANETSGSLTPSSGVFYLPKGGSWQDRTLMGTNTNPDMRFWTNDVVIDPANTSIWYAGVRNGHGGNGNDAGGLYRSIDSGVTWQRVFVSSAVESVAIGPSGDIYVATETDGLYYSPTTTNLSATLSRVTSFPFQHPIRIYFDPYENNRVFVATFGSGVIAENTGDFTPPTITAASFSASATKPALSINFSETVPANLVTAGAFIKNLTTGKLIPASAFTATYNAASNQVKLVANVPLPDGNYRLTYPALSLTDTAGNPLAADYHFDFFVLAGDANSDRTVGFADLVALAQHYGATTGVTFAQGDFNYDGKVDFADLVIVAQKYGTSLPPPPPAAALLTPQDDAVIGKEARTSKAIFATKPIIKLTNGK